MSRKLLIVDGASLAVRLFYAKGGGDLLDKGYVRLEYLVEFVQDVARSTVENIQRRVDLDGYSDVRVALESLPEHPLVRYSTYPDYKHAQTMADKPRIATTLQPYLLTAMGGRLPGVWSPGMEADDVIASMVQSVRKRLPSGLLVDIWSYDQDLQQALVHDNVRLLGKQGEAVTRADVVASLDGLEGTALPVLHSLTGDQGANVPGIHGVGPKTALKWVRSAPKRTPNPYVIDVSLIKDPEMRQHVAQLLPRLHRDEELLTLERHAPLELYRGG